ncbi:MAG TPA: hypothetical protein VJI75_02905 [Candidatus Nanoarchaeia archaeon]|nr:hypothetical protein [Candidatus Nanoarchaeia archaeon]
MRASTIFILAMLVILAGVGIFMALKQREANAWVIAENGKEKVNVPSITGGEAYVDPAQNQQYDSIGTVFSFDGWYKGQSFFREFKDESGKTLMRITSELTPGDGVPEGYIVHAVEDSKPRVYIFVDDDWKEKIPSRIYWGRSYEKEKDLAFTEFKNGIFMDSIDDDPERFEDGYSTHYGGIWVGDLQETPTSTLMTSK